MVETMARSFGTPVGSRHFLKVTFQRVAPCSQYWSLPDIIFKHAEVRSGDFRQRFIFRESVTWMEAQCIIALFRREIYEIYFD